MAYLFGKFKHTIDAKGRLSIPHRLRDQLIIDDSRQLVVLGGFEGCLFCYHAAHFKHILDTLGQQSFDRADTRELLRCLSEYGSQVDMDAQGRIPLTEEQRDIAGLSTTCLLLGVGSRIEIWSPERFEDRPNRADGAALAEGVLHTVPNLSPESKE